MKYVYDIILNFNDNYFEFYDWNKKDEITEIRKIPIFKVSNQVLYEIKNYTVQFDDLFISKIKNKTEYFSGRIIKLETAFLITDGLDVIAIKIGKKLKYSSLQINEELDILEDLNMIETSISYKKNAKNNIDNLKTRNQMLKENKVKKILNIIINEKDTSKIKYIYYECFNEKESDKNKIIDKFNNSMNNKKIIEKLYKILNYSFNESY